MAKRNAELLISKDFGLTEEAFFYLQPPPGFNYKDSPSDRMADLVKKQKTRRRASAVLSKFETLSEVFTGLLGLMNPEIKVHMVDDSVAIARFTKEEDRSIVSFLKSADSKTDFRQMTFAYATPSVTGDELIPCWRREALSSIDFEKGVFTTQVRVESLSNSSTVKYRPKTYKIDRVMDFIPQRHDFVGRFNCARYSFKPVKKGTLLSIVDKDYDWAKVDAMVYDRSRRPEFAGVKLGNFEEELANYEKDLKLAGVMNWGQASGAKVTLLRIPRATRIDEAHAWVSGNVSLKNWIEVTLEDGTVMKAQIMELRETRKPV